MRTDGTTAEVEAGAVPRGVTPPSGAGGRFLSDVIVQLGFAGREAVDQALDASRAPGKKLGTTLVEMGAVTERQLGRAVAERYRLDFLDLSEFDIDPEAVYVIGDAEMRRYDAVPVAFTEDGALVVAMIDPADWLAAEEMAQMTGRRIRRAVAAPSEVTELIGRVAEARAGEADSGGADSGDTTGLPARLTLRPVSRPLAGRALGREFGIERPDSEGASNDQPVSRPDEAPAGAEAPQAESGEAQVIPIAPAAAQAEEAPSENVEASESPASSAPVDQTLGPDAITDPDNATPATAGPWRAPTSEPPAGAEVGAGEPSETDETASETTTDAEPDSQSPTTGDEAADDPADAAVAGEDEPSAGEETEETESTSEAEAAISPDDATEPEVASEPDAPAEPEAAAESADATEPEAATEPVASIEPTAPAEEAQPQPIAATGDSKEIASLRAELTEARAQLSEAQAAQVRTRDELDGARGDLATLRGRYEGALERTAEAERQLAESRAHAGRLEAEIEASKEQAQALRDDLTWARSQIEHRSEREEEALAELRGHIEAMKGLRPVDPPPPPAQAVESAPAETSEPVVEAPATQVPADSDDTSLTETPAPDAPSDDEIAAMGADASTPSAELAPSPVEEPAAHANGSGPAADDGGGTNKARGLKRLIAAVRRL